MCCMDSTRNRLPSTFRTMPLRISVAFIASPSSLRPGRLDLQVGVGREDLLRAVQREADRQLEALPRAFALEDPPRAEARVVYARPDRESVPGIATDSIGHGSD